MTSARAWVVPLLVLALISPVASAGLLSGILAPSDPGEVLVGFDGPVDTLLLRSLGATLLRTLDDVRVAHVSTTSISGLLASLATVPGVSFAETNDALRLSGAWNGVTYSASSWDASSWDASGWDASSWDASSWDASSWDASSWDASSWDASSWDASSWDASSWDASSWDASSWDASSWDASSWDSDSMDAGYVHQWGLGAANFPDAWTIERGNGRIGVCVLDTGVVPHPDLAPHLLRSASGAYGASALLNGANPLDDVGHGTHVAGIIAAVSGNATGITGAANEPILSVKVLNAQGGREADLAQGLSICSKSGARIATMSLHIDKASPTVKRAIEDAQARGLLLIAAAGNGGTASVAFPAAYANVIAVGAHTPSAARASFSNYGARLDVLAPGDHIVSTFLDGGYRSGSGTSQAAPFVAAAAALVWEQDQTASAMSVRATLLATARDLGAAGRDDATGWGALDAGAAVASAR